MIEPERIPANQEPDPVSRIEPLRALEPNPEPEPSYATDRGNWDYNPAYPAIEMGQRLKELEQQAAQIDRQQRELAAQKQMVRSQLELADCPNSEGLFTRLDEIEFQINKTGQEMAAISQRMNQIDANLKSLSREIEAVSRPPGPATQAA